MIDSITIRYTGPVPGGESFTACEWNAIKRQAWEEVGRFWHEEIRPKHFTREGAREYGYTPRAGETGNARKKFWTSYTGRKQKTKGHTMPLVNSGELRAMSRVARIVATATSTRSRLRVVLPQAQKANFKNKHSQIDMRDELTRVSDAEVEQLARLYEQAIERLLAEHHATAEAK